jgi:hypothetical protein
MRAGAMVALGIAAAIATGASIAASGLPAQARGHADDRAAGRSAPVSMAGITSARVRPLRGPVIELAADRTWTAALVAGRDCVVAWSPLRNQLVRLTEIASRHCDDDGPNDDVLFGLNMFGTRVTWWIKGGCSNDGCWADTSWSSDIGRPGRVDEDRSDPTPAPGKRGPAETRRGVAFSFHGSYLRLRRNDGRVRIIRTPETATPRRFADAEFETTGLYYAYNTTGTFRSRVVFIPFGELFAAQ